ncbi:MAG: HPr(Ser) kinase/phosphatase [Parasporobacterium sp.]|nr:HPr(Ser) kinase/phosphatase [Parasporobacterium sp.]
MAKTYVTMAEVAEKMELENLTPSIDLASRKVYHRSINRPAFQLAGYYDYFDYKRLQIIGRAEYEYLKNLTVEQRLERFEKLFAFAMPGIIVCRGLKFPQEVLDMAVRANIPILSSEKTTAFVIVNTINWIYEQLAPTETMYGVLVDVYGEGILITGKSGVGKSETAVELVKRGHRLVADDLVEIFRVSENMVVGSAPDMTRHFVELRGIGVVDVKSLYGVESVKEATIIDMIINLEEWDGQAIYDRLGLNEEHKTILGVDVVYHNIPIRTGRNLAIIIETAAVNNRQKKMGYNAAQELCDRISNEIHRKEELMKKGITENDSEAVKEDEE